MVAAVTWVESLRMDGSRSRARGLWTLAAVAGAAALMGLAGCVTDVRQRDSGGGPAAGGSGSSGGSDGSSAPGSDGAVAGAGAKAGSGGSGGGAANGAGTGAKPGSSGGASSGPGGGGTSSGARAPAGAGAGAGGARGPGGAAGAGAGAGGAGGAISSAETPATSANLAGTWRLVTLDGKPISAMLPRGGVGDSRPNLTFAADGGVTGFGGVNRLSSRVTLGPDSGQVKFAPAIMTRMAGAPELMRIENRLGEVLGKANRATVRGGVLRLSDGATDLAAFSR